MHDPRKMFDAANEFYAAETCLVHQLNNGAMALAIPWDVIAAFTLELYLKCLITIENNSYAGSHDLRKLFHILTEDSQQFARNHFNASEKTNPHRAYMAQAGLAMTLDDALDRSRNAFAIMRYPYEDRYSRRRRMG